MRVGLVGAAACASVMTLAIGCSSNDRAPSTADSPGQVALRPISVPDLSRASEPVQQQLRERYARLMARLNNQKIPASELANDYGELGQLFMAAEYREAAEPCFLNAQALTPADGRWPYYLGHLYRLKGELTKAATFFERAVELRPDEVAALVWLGNVYLLEGRPEAAEPLFTKALSRRPQLASALYGLGRAALAKRDYGRAVKHLEEALAQDPLASSVHYPLAVAYRGLGALDKADAHFARRGQIDPAMPDPLMAALNESLHSAMGYERLGIEALDRKEWDVAAAYFRKGVELAPDRATVRHRLGTALFVKGDTRGALEQFEEVVRLSPEFAKARYSLGVLMMGLGREQDALEQLSTAVRLDPGYIEARLRLAEVLRRSGRAAASLSEYEEVIKIDPRAAEARFGMAVALIRLQRYREARDRLRDGIRIHPAQPEFSRALARLLACAPDDGVRDGREAIALAQQLLEQRQTLDLGETMAMALAELGRYDQAALFQREVMAAAQKGGHQELLNHLARNLELYERRQPCRTPLRADDPVEAFEPVSDASSS